MHHTREAYPCAVTVPYTALKCIFWIVALFLGGVWLFMSVTPFGYIYIVAVFTWAFGTPGTVIGMVVAVAYFIVFTRYIMP